MRVNVNVAGESSSGGKWENGEGRDAKLGKRERTEKEGIKGRKTKRRKNEKRGRKVVNTTQKDRTDNTFVRWKLQVDLGASRLSLSFE